MKTEAELLAQELGGGGTIYKGSDLDTEEHISDFPD